VPFPTMSARSHSSLGDRDGKGGEERNQKRHQKYKWCCVGVGVLPGRERNLEKDSLACECERRIVG